MDPDAASPSPSLLANLRQDLARHAPFGQMDQLSLDFFITHSEQRYYAPGDELVAPAAGPVAEVFFIREGAVTGQTGPAGDALEFQPGELFPLGAALAGRPADTAYRATADTFVLALPATALRELVGRDPLFADFLQRRMQAMLALSRQALQEAYASQALAGQSLETPLGDLLARPAVTCGPATPLGGALAEMHERRIGSMLVVDGSGRPLGILTRHDVLGRVALPQLPLATPIAHAMSQPVHTLDERDTAQDAALLMARHGIRHVPVTRDGRAVGLVSERDLFALQRLSLKQVGAALRAAPDVVALQRLAADIRAFARSLLAQGVQARQLTALISHLNDLLTQRIVALEAGRHRISLDRVCWLALGSEGRSEQTVATDQDNALILADDATPDEQAAALAFGRAVNLALADCGYPLCSGGIMAGEPGGCATLAGWRARFAGWIAHGAPQDLLDASIYFDLRPLAGQAALAQALHAEVASAARATPRFLKQLALNALQRSAPFNWLGALELDARGGLDLKLRGTALFVEAARIYALAHGVAATNTRERLEGAGARMGLAAAEYEGWTTGFEFLQLLRLRVQLDGEGGSGEPNRIELAALNDIDRRILREALAAARFLQQRLRLDYER